APPSGPNVPRPDRRTLPVLLGLGPAHVEPARSVRSTAVGSGGRLGTPAGPGAEKLTPGGVGACVCPGRRRWCRTAAGPVQRPWSRSTGCCPPPAGGARTPRVL